MADRAQSHVRKAEAVSRLRAVATAFALISGIAGLAFNLVPGLAGSSDSSKGSGLSSVPTWVYVVAGLSVTLGAGAVAYREALVRQRRRTTEDYGETIARNAQAGASHAEVRAKIEAEAAPGEVDLALSEVEKFFIDASPELRIVEGVILQHPPALPRAAKRMMNHARLLTGIANARGLFDGGSPLTPTHLGKWIVVTERWPSLAQRIARDPRVMARLEQAKSREDLDEVLAGDRIALEELDDLGTLLGEEPQLGPSVQRLIHLDRPPSNVIGRVDGGP
jgi:hypothetical protein